MALLTALERKCMNVSSMTSIPIEFR